MTPREDEYDLAQRRAWGWRPSDTEVTDTERRVARTPYVSAFAGIYTHPVPAEALSEIGPVMIGIDPGAGDEGVDVVAELSKSGRVTFHYDAPPFVDPAMVAAAVATPPKRTTFTDLVSAIAPLMLEEITRKINTPYWGMLGQLLHRYHGPNDPGDEHVPDPRFPNTEADACVTDLELLEYHLRDVRSVREVPTPASSRRNDAAARLRRSTARDIEARLLRELQRED